MMTLAWRFRIKAKHREKMSNGVKKRFDEIDLFDFDTFMWNCYLISLNQGRLFSDAHVSESSPMWKYDDVLKQEEEEEVKLLPFRQRDELECASCIRVNIVIADDELLQHSGVVCGYEA